MKKAQGLPITTVILAVLGIVVLFVMIGIMTGKTQMFGTGLEQAAEGVCPGETKIAYQPCGDGKIELYGRFKGVNVGYKCCVVDPSATPAPTGSGGGAAARAGVPHGIPD